MNIHALVCGKAVETANRTTSGGKKTERFLSHTEVGYLLG